MRSRATLSLVLLMVAVVLPQFACAQEDLLPEDVVASYRAGRYAEAIELGRGFLERTPGDREMRQLVVASLDAIGHYPDALREAESLPVSRGRILMELGRYEEASEAFQQAVDAGDPDSLTAELHLAIIRFERGEREDAMARFDRFIDVYNSGAPLSAADLTAVGTAVRYLGMREPALFQDALKAYDEAVAKDPEILEPRVLLGEMFIDRYDSQQAHGAFEEVFAINRVHPRALVGMARAKHFDGDVSAAFEYIDRALQINYQLVPAFVLRARMMIEGENGAEAEENVRRALEVNPSSLEALTVLATIRYLRGDDRGFAETRDRVLSLNPTYGDFYVTIAEVAAQHRRYAEAVRLARLAVETDPESWAGLGTLGINALRLGDVEGARTALTRSFDGDPYNVWIYNTLDLLDTFDEYEVRESRRFRFMLHGDEADLLYPYFASLAEEAYDSLAARYGHQPETPITVEVYPRHADFSVRTVGLTGLGALGVAFGSVLALDSPSAREPGLLNWGTTLWHELAHTVALEMSNSRVPRWFTEGLSVYEERRARTGWGSETTADYVLAYDRGEIPPVSQLNRGFSRPPSPRHLSLAYHGASLVIEWIDEEYGFPAIVRMLREYGEGRSNEEVLRRVLGAEAEQIDGRFDAWFRARYPVGEVESYRDRLARARLREQEGGHEEVESLLPEEAIRLFADSDPTPHALLGRARLARGDTVGAIAALARVAEIDENAYSVNALLSQLAEGRDPGLQAAALDRLAYIHPYDVEHRRRLAELYASEGDAAGAVRERRAVVALRPVDRAEALYQLALALRDAGEPQEARRQVIRALETAPAFERAQELLLELSGGT